MKKRLVKSIAVLLTMVMLFSIAAAAPVGVGAAESDSAAVGESNFEWNLDDDGTLTITGEGELPDYDGIFSLPPWHQENDKIEFVVIGQGITHIGNHSFQVCENLLRVSIPDSVISIGEFSFQTCLNLESLHIPNSVISIGSQAFNGCDKLKNLTIPGSVISIGNFAFDNCDKLESVTIENGVKEIGTGAFSVCNKLSSISIPDSVTSIGASAFFPTAWEKNQPDGMVYAGKVAYEFKGSYPDSLTFRDDTLGIADKAFDNCKITSVTIPDSVQHIGEESFANCFSLEKLTIGGGIKSMGVRAFGYCNKLEDVKIADGAEIIGKTAFLGCKSLIYLSIPNSVKEIGEYAFSGCSKLPIVTIPQSTAVIRNCTFINCTSLKIVNIPESVNRIEDNAFYGCSGLNEIFYDGSQLDWKKIEIGYNKYLEDVIIHFNDTKNSRKQQAIEQTRITVYQKENGKNKAANLAKVEYNGTSYTTDKHGVVCLPKVDAGSITVSKNGYITRTVTAEQLKKSTEVVLEPVEQNAPVIKAVWIDDTDVLKDSYALEMTSTAKTTVKAEVDWGKNGEGNIKLCQSGKTLEFKGNTLTAVISDTFDTSKTITILATDAKNHSAEKEVLIQNGTVNKVLSSLDGSGLSFNDEISLTIPGDIPLISGTEVGAGLSSLVPFNFTAEDGKVYISLGVQLFSFSNEKNIGSDKSDEEEPKANGLVGTVKEKMKSNKEAIDQLKDVFKSVKDGHGAAEKLNGFKKLFDDAKDTPKGKFGVSADFSVLGFLEGTYDEKGRITFVDTGVILNPSVALSYTYPFSIGPVPLYFEAGFSASALAKLNIRLNEQAKKFVPNGELSGEISLSGGVGIGVKNVLYAGGGLEGQLIPDWQINLGSKDYFTLKAKLKAYAKAGILFFEAKKDWDLAEKTVLEYPNYKSVNSVGAMLDDFNVYDYSNYKIKNLSYLSSKAGKSTPDEAVVATADSPVGLSSKTGKNTAGEAVGATANNPVGNSALKTNIYRESTPQLVVFDNGTKLAVWTDSNSDDINEICLYYSFFNGSSWTAPAKVDNDGTMDYAPQLAESNGTAYLVWQNATKAFDLSDENLSLETIAKDFDISAAVFDGSKFTTTTFTNDNLDMQPVICSAYGNAHIAWVNNSSNDWFGNNANNSILVSSYNNGAWTEPTVQYSGLNSVNGLAIDYKYRLSLAYCLDTDGDMNTTDDWRIYENGKLVSDESKGASSPQYCNNTLYWFSGNSILSSDINAADNGVISSDRYQLVNSEGTTAAVFTKGNGLRSALCASYFNSKTGKWSEPKVLVDNNSFIGSFSADTDSNGNIIVLMNDRAVTGTYGDEDPYGEADLTLFADTESCDISLSEPVYKNETFCQGTAMTFYFDVTNNGTKTVDGVNVTITDSNGKVLSSTTVDKTIVPGETLETSAYYVPDGRYVSQNVTITVTPKNNTDSNPSDNSQSVTLSYENMSVENLTRADLEDGKTSITADIINYGYQARGPVTVKLIKDSLDGTVVDTKVINSIGAMDLAVVSFEIDGNNNGIFFVSIGEEADDFSADNSDFIPVSSEYAIGDANLDGKINIRDVTAIQRHIADIEKFNDAQLAVADTNGDGAVDISDATHLQRYLAEYNAVLGKQTV